MVKEWRRRYKKRVKSRGGKGVTEGMGIDEHRRVREKSRS
jgi:hypothetical protein